MIVSQPPAELAPSLLCLVFRAASLQPPTTPEMGALLDHCAQALAESDPKRLNPSHLAAVAASIPRIQEAWGDAEATRFLCALSAQVDDPAAL